MDILGKYAMLMALLHSVGEVQGRKKLQKLVYLLQEAGYPFEEDFSYHLYGPYSETLAAEIDELKLLGLLQEREAPTPGGYTQYVYSLSEQGRRYARRFRDQLRLPGLEELARKLTEHGARTLELMASLAFLKRMGYPDAEASRYVRAIKPEQRYRDQEIADALGLVRNLLGKEAGEEGGPPGRD